MKIERFFLLESPRFFTCVSNKSITKIMPTSLGKSLVLVSVLNVNIQEINGRAVILDNWVFGGKFLWERRSIRKGQSTLGGVVGLAGALSFKLPSCLAGS